jgi:hypothetical protein
MRSLEPAPLSDGQAAATAVASPDAGDAAVGQARPYARLGWSGPGHSTMRGLHLSVQYGPPSHSSPNSRWVRPSPQKGASVQVFEHLPWP